MRRLLVAATLAALAPTPAAFAAEGGAGFYLLGSRAINAGIVAPPGTYVQASLYGFSGSTDATIPVGGELNVGLDARAAIGFLTGLWVPETGKVAGGRPYVMLLLPYGWKQAKVTATLEVPNGPDLSGERTENGTDFGDPALGAGLGWGKGPWFGSVNLLVNVPAGPYEDGSATNISFHRWSADLTGAFTYLWQEGWQGNLAVGLTVNGENPATDYTTGNELHLEGALAKGFGGWTLGLAGYHYDQVTGDSGDGAVLGDFKGRVSGLGPTVAWTGAWGRQPVVFGASYFHEFDEKNRVPGDILFLNLTFPLGAAEG
jgi:hypothetical protein